MAENTHDTSPSSRSETSSDTLCPAGADLPVSSAVYTSGVSLTR